MEHRDVNAAIVDLLEENGDYYSERLATLSPMQRLLMTALSWEPTEKFAADYRSRYSLGASSTVHASLKAVVDAGLVESDETGYFLGDPFFARYIRQRPYEAN